MELTAPQLASVVTVANSAESATPKRTSLPPCCPPGLSDCPGPAVATRWIDAMQQRVRLRLCPVAGGHAGEPQHGIAPKTAQPCPGEPTILPSVMHASGGNQEDRSISKHDGSAASAFSKRVRAVGVEEAAAVCEPSILMASCDASGPMRNGLRRHGASSPGFPSAPGAVTVCGSISVTVSCDGFRVLNCALRDQRQRIHQADRQQHAHSVPRVRFNPQKFPSLLDRAANPADNAMASANARRRRPEVVRRQPRHLGQIAHRGFGHIRLPVWCWW